ncbi:DUF4432 family protein [Rhizobium rhizogenes]|uniref:DUF4432 domain-containing protein n=1 Tax=Rhizobium rhizogenes TaxID=359 RepID=A0AA92H7L5_RHIRH|nr:DUF4432 family protein [Rhizobium rhizogenes]PVE50619.1 DUF4432 domain-containing protein [Rhizobium rhizogenes]PVE62380.1 DUF4432 domain-containing protein [Agrobacterium tumefaciens]PVE70563.1 DUF4432 domain-containing protein [Sphingomonas sp. TPD3009]
MRITLSKCLFQALERTFLTSDNFQLSTFCFPTGVEALRVKTSRQELIILPFLGQQIWSASVDGRAIGMTSAVRYPKRNVSLLENLGGFFFHCGLTAIAAPGEGDGHPLHGELPNAELDEAWIDIGEDAKALSIGGSFEYARAFGAHYRFSPSIAFSAADPSFNINVEVENLRHAPMELCYLGHVNFRPIDGSKLIYTAPYTKDAVKVRSAIPAHLKPSAQYLQLLSELEAEPSRHHQISHTVAYDPEIVFRVNYLADEDGWAHGLQIHPNGIADWIAHRPEQLPHAFRWISRSSDQQTLAITEPATCGIDGYSKEKQHGRIPELAALGTWRATMRVGQLDADRVEAMQSRIDAICGR